MENCYHFKLPSLELGVLGVGAGGTFGLDFYFVFFHSAEHRNRCLGTMGSKNTSIHHDFIKVQ